MHTFYRYIVYYCPRGLNPKVWTEIMSWENDQLLTRGEIRIEAASRLDAKENFPIAPPVIVKVEVVRVTTEKLQEWTFH